MDEIIKFLVKLQEIDSCRDSFSEEINDTPEKISRISEEINLINENLKNMDEKYKNEAVKQSSLENDLRALEGEIKKMQVDLYSIKTNEAYKTLKTSIDEKKAKVSEIEDELLALMDGVEEQKKGLSKEKVESASKTGELKNTQNDLELRGEELIKQVTALNSERERFVAELRRDEKNRAAIEKYERIRQSKGGVAVVLLNENNSCSGCNMFLTKQKVNEVASSRLTLCDNCGRILYLDENRQG